MKKSLATSYIVLFVGLCCSSIFLSGCATTFNKKTGTFRNRELDYLHQPISQRSGLIIPNGVESPKLQPKNTLPAGPNNYPAENTVDMTPPGFSKNIPIPGEASKNKTSTTATSSAATQPVPSTPSKTVKAEPFKPKSTQEINAEIETIQAQIQHIKSQKQEPSSTENSTKKIEPQVTSNTPAPLSSASLPSGISSSLTFDSNNHGLLNISAPFSEAWKALQNAITQSGYSISKVDKGSHLIYVAIPTITSEDSASISAKNAPKATTYLLFVTRKDNVTQVSVFTDKGVLDSSASAYSLLAQLHGILGNPGNS